MFWNLPLEADIDHDARMSDDGNYSLTDGLKSKYLRRGQVAVPFEVEQ